MLSYKELVFFFTYVYHNTQKIDTFSMYLNRLYNKLFLYSTWNIPDFVDCDIVFFQSLDRNDYNNFTDTIISSLNKNIKYEYIKISAVKSFNFSIFQIPLKEHLRVIKDLPKEIGFFGKLFIYASIIQQLGICKKLRNYNVKMVVTHADMQPIENILIQYFKTNRVKTITLQHGLYVDYSQQPNINEVNYKNVVSDYFLSWGEETKRLIQKYHPECKIKICGNPILEDKEYIQSDFFVLIFEQEFLKEYNYTLLEIGREIESFLGIKLKVKFHPRNVFKDYTISRDEVVKFDTVYNAKFALGHTSTMMYQMMRLGIPTFKLASSVPCNVINQKLIFYSFDELKNLIEQSQSIDFKKEGEFYIKYLGAESLNTYTEFFQRLIDEKN